MLHIKNSIQQFIRLHAKNNQCNDFTRIKINAFMKRKKISKQNYQNIYSDHNNTNTM